MAPSATTYTETTTTTTPLTLSAVNTVFDRGLGDVQFSQYDEVKTSKELIGEALKARLDKIDHEVCEAGEEDAFFVADMGEVYRQHLRWKKNLKRVKPFYGKCFWLCGASDQH